MRKTDSAIAMAEPSVSLPTDYEPGPVKHFDVERIILSKGSLDTPERESFVRRICDVYPKVPIEEQLDTAHNRIRFEESSPMSRHGTGKRTLLFGKLKKAVLATHHPPNTYPDYWYFSVYGHCPYGCKYCYLAGTPGVWHSPSVKIYVNLAEIIAQISYKVKKLGKATGFHLGRFQDALALEPLAAYSTKLIPFFAKHRHARQVLLTKSNSVEHLLDLDHGGHTILAWSLNPPEIADLYEENLPSVWERIDAMERCAARGYPIRAALAPVIMHGDWESSYTALIRELLSRVRLQRLSLGRFFICPRAIHLMEQHLGKTNAITQMFTNRGRTNPDALFAPHHRDEVCGRLENVARSVQPDIEIGYCQTLE